LAVGAHYWKRNAILLVGLGAYWDGQRQKKSHPLTGGGALESASIRKRSGNVTVYRRTASSQTDCRFRSEADIDTFWRALHMLRLTQPV
jgi:hypothetical protein